MNTELDSKDQEILDARIKEWNQIKTPRVGDFIKMLDGSVRRFTHDWGHGLQTTVGTAHPCTSDQSFYFGGSFVSFSGSLDHTIPNEQIRSRHEMRDGSFWFFHHNMEQAHNGVGFTVPCRIYEQQRSERDLDLEYESRKDDALIVRSVNNADKLAEALERVLDVITGDQSAELGVYDALAEYEKGKQL